ncbi:MAG: hypothetical protein MJ106_07555 [Lentisphaeria bacterium]|nr:hypothetical protein [Lentisphaeria bacterium]
MTKRISIKYLQHTATALLVGVFFAQVAFAETPESFSWGGVDGLGRILPLQEKPSPERDRIVAMFYWTWHNSVSLETPTDNSFILTEYPEAVNDIHHKAWTIGLDSASMKHYFWGKPLFGYYTDLDPWVLAKHAEMLADAGVDVIFFDATNGTETWMQETEALCQVFQTVRQHGIKAPQIAFMLNFAPNENTAVELRQLYKDIYSKGRYRDLWFQWDGKPMIMAHPEALSRQNPEDAEILDFFTFRRNEAGYITKDTDISAQRWGWCSNYPQTRFGIANESPSSTEEMVVSVAQNSTAHRLCAMNDPKGGVFGRGFAKENYTAHFPLANGKSMSVDISTPEAWQWGLNFQQQFDFAIKNDPKVIFVTGWNEWIAGRHDSWQETPNAFPDQFMPKFSRDIEPSENAPYDNFYNQLVYNVRRYKGGSALPPPVTRKSNPPQNGFDGWKDVQPLFSDPKDSWQRDFRGWKGCYYRLPMPPNDMRTAKASFDDTNLYFYLQCEKEIVPNTRLRLLLATGNEGWEGFDFVVQRTTDGGFALSRLLPGTEFKTETIAVIASCTEGTQLAIAIPLTELGLAADFDSQIQFKWSDEQNLDKSALSFYTEGDCAPNGRFRYVLTPEKP